MDLVIKVYQDGDAQPWKLGELINAWENVWQSDYQNFASIQFRTGLDLKQTDTISLLPESLLYIASIRNPDLYFVEETQGVELGGIEITTHSPDGSNMDKRYPYIWASRRRGISAFVCSSHSKQRPSGQVNRFPYRHAQRNLQFLGMWDPDNAESALWQMLPIRELQPSGKPPVPSKIWELIPAWTELGAFFAHLLAARVLHGEVAVLARLKLHGFQQRFLDLAQACQDATKETAPSSLLKLPGRWIQVYNTRPDTGHWERGEGQFDSIDGRVMFTLDEISLLGPDTRPSRFEFWLPQIVSSHPWVREQRERGFQSKRFKNLVQLLSEECPTRFADDLSDDDWRILQDNPGVVLERLDWLPAVYKVTEVVRHENIDEIASRGRRTLADSEIQKIRVLLRDDHLYFSTHRAYRQDWEKDLRRGLNGLSPNSVVLIPRIPRKLIVRALSGISNELEIVPAEECEKAHLLMLRQIHCCR